MLVLAPAACITSGIALSQAFDVFTRSIKFQLPGLSSNTEVDVSRLLFIYTRSLYSANHLMRLFSYRTKNSFLLLLIIKAGETSSATKEAQNDAVKTEKAEETSKDRPSRKSKKKEREHVEKPSTKTKAEKKRLLALPLEASVISLLLLVFLGAFYVVLYVSFLYPLLAWFCLCCAYRSYISLSRLLWL